MGDINPNTLDSFTIESLAFTKAFYNTDLYINDSYGGKLHLGRSDTRNYYGESSSGGTDWFRWNTDYVQNQSDVFTNDDIGKQVPIWLATTPPLWA